MIFLGGHMLIKLFKIRMEPQNIIFISILFILFIIFFRLDCKQTESQNLSNIDSINFKFENINNEKLERQINFLIQNKTETISWVDRKETNAWAAFAFYLTGIGLLTKFLVKDRPKYINKFVMIIFIFIILIIAISMFSFIHAQYSSIYGSWAGMIADNSLILKIMDEGKPLSNFESCREALYKREMREWRPFMGNIHALKVFKYYILFDWTKSDIKERKFKRNVNTQEGAIYFLMILFNLGILYILLSNACTMNEKKDCL